jgi:hypothetical protein
MEYLEGFLYGAVGGLFAELLGLFKLRREAPSNLPDWLKSPFYWCITLAMICAGGLVVVIYLRSGIPLKPIIAVNVGASAPLIISTLSSHTPSVDVGKSDLGGKND